MIFDAKVPFEPDYLHASVLMEHNQNASRFEGSSGLAPFQPYWCA